MDQVAPYRRFIIWLLVPVTLWSLVFGALVLWCGPLSGDLTRIGRWPERDYAPRLPQSPVQVHAHTTDSMADARIFIHGDSFSAGNVWQSVFEDVTGERTLTFHHQQVGCLENWVRWVESQARPRGVVIFEVIERDFTYRFASLAPCAPSVPRLSTSAATEFSPETWQPGFRNLPVDALYAFRAGWNTLQAGLGRDRILYNNVLNVAIDGPGLFSSGASDRLLYYAEDHSKGRWTPAEIRAAFATLDEIQRRVEALGMRFMVVVVPDKSSIYRDYVTGPNRVLPPPILFDQELVRRGVAFSHLDRIFRAAATDAPDLYLPNDTHLGSVGYRLMGEAVAKMLLNSMETGR